MVGSGAPSHVFEMIVGVELTRVRLNPPKQEIAACSPVGRGGPFRYRLDKRAHDHPDDPAVRLGITADLRRGVLDIHHRPRRSNYLDRPVATCIAWYLWIGEMKHSIVGSSRRDRIRGVDGSTGLRISPGEIGDDLSTTNGNGDLYSAWLVRYTVVLHPVFEAVFAVRYGFDLSAHPRFRTLHEFFGFIERSG